MYRKLGAIAAASVLATFGFARAASAETGPFSNANGEQRTWTLTGLTTCTSQPAGTWSVAWSFHLDQDDGAGVTFSAPAGTTGFTPLAAGTSPLDRSGVTAGLTAATTTLNLGFTLVPDGIPSFADVNGNGVQDLPDEADQFVPPDAASTPPLLPVLSGIFAPQTAIATVAKPSGCTATPTVPTTQATTTTTRAVVVVTAAPTVAAATVLPSTGAGTNRLAVLAALAVMAGLGFFTAARPMARRRTN